MSLLSLSLSDHVCALCPPSVLCVSLSSVRLLVCFHYDDLIGHGSSAPRGTPRSPHCKPSPQDCEDPNPLIRALAVRTMGCIRVDKITEYLCEPLRKCLKDEDPYVRKTAAVCVAKLHDINAQLVEDQGFLDTLKDLISDSNPMVRLTAGGQ